MRRYQLLGLSCLIFLGLALVLSPPALAQAAGGQGVEQINTFITNIIKIIASLAGLIATGFFIVGGLSYITSSGNPAALQRAKRTIVFAALGLIITIAAFALTGVISTIATQAFGNS